MPRSSGNRRFCDEVRVSVINSKEKYNSQPSRSLLTRRAKHHHAEISVNEAKHLVKRKICLLCETMYEMKRDPTKVVSDREGQGHRAVLYKSHFPPLRHSFYQRHHCIHRLINHVYTKDKEPLLFICPTTWWQLGHKTLRSQEY